jgi:hypothetical protein
MYTTFVTTNPSPLASDVFFEMAGKPYSFDPLGKPGPDRPKQLERWRTVASKPAKAAVFFHLFVEAFQEVLLGWPPGAQQQEGPNCFFGQVLGFFFKYETTGRGDLHMHMCLVQPLLQPGHLLSLAQR